MIPINDTVIHTTIHLVNTTVITTTPTFNVTSALINNPNLVIQNIFNQFPFNLLLLMVPIVAFFSFCNVTHSRTGGIIGSSIFTFGLTYLNFLPVWSIPIPLFLTGLLFFLDTRYEYTYNEYGQRTITSRWNGVNGYDGHEQEMIQQEITDMDLYFRTNV